MNTKLYNKKGLTFKGAFVVVIIAHVVGACCLYGYSTYKSNQLKLARQNWKDKLEHRDNSNDDWKIQGLSSKIVAKPRSLVSLKPEKNTAVDLTTLFKKAEKTTLSLLTKTADEANSAIHDIKINKQIFLTQSTSIIGLPATKKKTKLVKEVKSPNVLTTTSSLKLNKAYPTPTPVVVVSTIPPKKTTSANIIPKPNPIPKTTQVRAHLSWRKPNTRTPIEYDYETQETVQTFYSY